MTEQTHIKNEAATGLRKPVSAIKDAAAALKEIDNKADLIYRTADEIWSHPELSMLEYHACDYYCKVLKDEGFEVTKGFGGIETAFKASFGNGRPHIAILAEYDALSGLSQKACCESRMPRDTGDTSADDGHGCGHNLLGAGALAAAIGIKKFLSEAGIQGTVSLFGCPGEEGVASKAFFARDGVWQDVDIALTWHPDDCNEVVVGSTNACIQYRYDFTGIAAHASGNPEDGRSALDAVELMNVGVQFLREHMSSKARIHYSILDAGGPSPNVVQPRASVLYMVRADKVSEALALQRRVDKIADGAALMTETSYTKTFVDGLSETVPNHSLERLLFSFFRALGVPQHTDEEKKFAYRLSLTYPGRDKTPGLGSRADGGYAANVERLRRNQFSDNELRSSDLSSDGRGGDEPGNSGFNDNESGGNELHNNEISCNALRNNECNINMCMNDFLLPLYEKETFEPGSTDVGDVSWNVPTAQIHVASWPNGCPGHSWQSTSSAGGSIGKKAALHAGKILAAAAIRLFLDPVEIEKAREEFGKRTAGGYSCPIPEGAIARPVF